MADFILGSGSAGRRMILENAGLDFAIRRPDVDEEALKEQFLASGGNPEELAMPLAEAKAVAVSRGEELPVLGADQVLVCDGRLFSKPRDMEQARENLKILRGRPHRLISALAVARGGEVVWRHVASAEMVMRDFSDEFLDWYLDKVGDKALSSVGCYQVEGPGIQLFRQVEADWFTIIGLPLLPFLDWLRGEGIIAA